VVNVAGQADVTDQGATVALRITTPGLKFSPTYVKATPGATLTITLVNPLTVTDFGNHHTFTIDALGVKVDLPPEAHETVTIALPSDGVAVAFHCSVGGSAGHTAGGMQGAFFFG
jgi:plastocyanin